ncbi:MAG TPA: phosphoserine transaminase [Sphingomonadaceae bacterium]|nr:phosphoserine transaminase [Sphingomonadaceae bacterium]
MTDSTPQLRPARPHFSSGPCAKPPGWSPDKLDLAVLGRSHRSGLGKSRLKRAIDLTREVLRIPETHRIGIVPASDTGAVEMAMWTMLGARPVTVAAWESFGQGWVTDAIKQLRLDPTILDAPYGKLPDLSCADSAHDIVFTWNGTTSGVRVPDAGWIADDRAGLTICDATSAAFAMDLPWHRLDATTFSWQKAMGGEAAHGVLVLGPRAVERLETFVPDRPLPKIFRLTSKGKLIKGVFQGETINTPSMLCVEDYIFSLEWGQALGGLPALIARADANADALQTWVDRTTWIENLAADPATRSNTSVCLRFTEGADPAARMKAIAKILEGEDVAYDIAMHRDAPPGLRIWCGATVDTADVEALTPWLDWAWAKTA